MDSAETRRLMAEVSAQHGIRIDADDPIMAVVALNGLVLERTFGTATDLIKKATEEFNRATERVQIRAGSVLAEEVREAVATVRAEIQKDIDNARLKAAELVTQVHWAESRSRNWRWIVIGLFAGVALFVAGVLTGFVVR